MVVRINEAFDDKEFLKLKDKKDALQKELKKTKLTWHDFILHVAGVKQK